jgi:hypothetical protein
MATTVAELQIEVRASTAQTQKSMADLHKQLTGLEKANAELAASNAKMQKSFDSISATGSKLTGNLQRAAAAARLLVAAIATGAIAKLANDAVQSTLALSNLSLSTGISTERLSELRGAAEQVGIPFDQLTQSISQFAQRMREGLANATSDTSLALRALNISAIDAQGSVRTFADIIPEVANQFSTMADGINKAQIASALFGEEAGPKLIPLLNQSAAGVEKLVEKFKEYGVITGPEAVANAREYNLAQFQLSGALHSVVQELTLMAGPSIAGALSTLAGLIKDIRQSMGIGVSEYEQVARRLQATQIKVFEQTEQLRQQAEKGGPSWWEWLSFPQSQFEGDLANETMLLERFKILREQFVQSTTTTTPTPGGGGEGLLRMRQATEQARFDFEQYMTMSTGQRTMLQDLDFAFVSHADIIEQAQARIRDAYGETAEAHRMLARTTQSVNIQMEQQALGVARMAAQTITTLFPKQKNAAIAAATINTSVAVTEALKLTFPLNWIQAGLVIASGAAQIAAIRSTSASGGGSLASVSGGGGGDAGASQATPMPQDDTGGRSVTIVMQPNSLWSTEQVQGLIERINGEVAEGAVLISTTTKAF